MLGPIAAKMAFRLLILAWLGYLVASVPVPWDDSKCAQKCNGGSKYQYSQQTTYIYSYETLNDLHVPGSSELSMGMKATVEITAISQCEMVLQITDVELTHGALKEISSPFAARLMRNPLPFSFNDGTIEHVCPSPEDTEDSVNVKKAILSSLQNTMKSMEYNYFERETDIFGACDTDYKIKEQQVDRYVIQKTKNILTCSDHLKMRTLFLSSLYESASHRQHLPLMSDETMSCRQVINQGLVEEVFCDETANFKPLWDYGYVIKGIGKTKLTKMSSKPAERIMYRTTNKENLVFTHKSPQHSVTQSEEETKAIVQHICDHSGGLLKKDVANYVHKLVYAIRRMDDSSVENIYTALKNKELCNSQKALSIYLDAVKAASSGAAIKLLAKLVMTGEMSQFAANLWMTLLPFSSFLEAESIEAAIPLLRKDLGYTQALLGVSAMTYKFCSNNEGCESLNAVKEVSSSLKQFLGDKCQTSNEQEEKQVLTALKSFGNLGYVGESKADLFECAKTSENKMSIRVAAVEAFRRTPCSEDVISNLLEIYKDQNVDDEVRIAALISISKCANYQVIKSIAEVYETETSKQVEVFTWSYLNNLKTTSDPMKRKQKKAAATLTLKTPQSTDITKFSRNFEWSFFSELLNMGQEFEGNIIHSRESFLPRSGEMAFKIDLYGNQLNLFETGFRAEALEYALERLFGPRGLMPNLTLADVLSAVPHGTLNRNKRSADAYLQKVDSLTERFNYQREKNPHGSAFFRILGHELMWNHFDKDALDNFAGLGVNRLLKDLASTRNIDVSKNLLFIDASILIPSITGRAYKLAINASATWGLKANGKLDIRQPHLPIPRANIDGRFQPSISAEMSAAMSIYSEDYEPELKAVTTLNVGLDLETKFEFKDGRYLHVKLKRTHEKSELASIKRVFYLTNYRGQTELPKPKSHDLEYCTKYIEHILGVRYCTKLTIPHVFVEGKAVAPFIQALEGSITYQKTEPDMQGYEFILELPESGERSEKYYKLFFDTPGSSTNRKFSLEFTEQKPSDDACSTSLKLSTPFYSADVDTNYINSAHNMQLKIDAVGDGRRKYSVALNVAKDVRGARLVEYQPQLTVILPNTRPMEFSGTIVFSRGRKEQININLSSSSFEKEFSIKGNMAKEGHIESLDAEWKLNADVNINAFSYAHRLHARGGKQEGGFFIDIGHHFEPDGKAYESITLNAKMSNVEFRDRISFTIECKALLAEHQDLSSMFYWDFSFKPLEHLRSDITIRYGKDFEDDTRLIRLVNINQIGGDFETFKRMHIENKLALTISCLDFDQSFAMTAIWDFEDLRKIRIEAGAKQESGKEISVDINYQQLSKTPFKLMTEAIFTYYDSKFTYRDQVQEIAQNEVQGRVLIEPSRDKQVTIDYVYSIKSTEEKFHHEVDATIAFPGLSVPVQHKALLAFSSDDLKFNSYTDYGTPTPFVIDVILQRAGLSEIKLNSPYIEGRLSLNTQSSIYAIQADFKFKQRDDRRIVVSGSVTPGDVNILNLDLSWDADKDSQKKLILRAKSNREVEDGIEKHMVSASINYIGTVNVDITGKISTRLLAGPHYMKADFTGGSDPMSIVYTHEIKDGHMTSVAQYLRSGVEKLRMNIKGKLIHRLEPDKYFELEGGLLLASPYKTFDGKELYGRLFAESNDEARSFIWEYRIKPAAVIGYVGKFDYIRKRGWPGNVKSNLLVTIHRRPIYQGSTTIDYGNGKYSWKTSFTPSANRSRTVNFLSTFEHASRFAAFHNSLSSSIQLLQNIQLNAVADLRNIEDYKIQSNFSLSNHKLYDVNVTLKGRSIVDFYGEALLFSKVTPSVHVFSKTQTTNQVTKYEMNLDVENANLITGAGELKKRKKGFNGEMTFKFKDREFLVLNINQEAKSQRERKYLIKAKTPWNLYTSNIQYTKEKKAIKYDTSFCKNEQDNCINIGVVHKETDDKNEYQIAYKRGDIEFNVERIRVSNDNLSRFHTVIYSGNKRYGYDVRLENEGKAKSVSLGIILPSREIFIKESVVPSRQNPILTFELGSDVRNHPDRKLVSVMKIDNHIDDDRPSKFDISVSHPVFEKPLELIIVANYLPNAKKFFTADISFDYSTDPDDKIIGKLHAEKLHGRSGQMVINIYHKDEQNLDFIIKVNASLNTNEESFAITTNWVDEAGADQDSYLIASFPSKEDKFYFAVHRPTLDYRLDGHTVCPENILESACEVQFTSVYKGQSTKAKMVTDEERGCHTLIIFDDEGKEHRNIEICSNTASRKLFSLTMQSFEEEQWVFDYALEVLDRGLGTINIRHHWNPEFLGGLLFQLTQLGEELEAAGIGTLPFYNSPRFKKIRASFYKKVAEPAARFIGSESRKFAFGIRNDIRVAVTKLRDYYNNKLPSFSTIKRVLEAVHVVMKEVGQELSEHIKAYYLKNYENMVRRIQEYRTQLRETCSSYLDCRRLLRAYDEGGWQGLLQGLERLLMNLPERIQEILQRSDLDVGRQLANIIEAAKEYLQPLENFRCGDIFFKTFELAYEATKPQFGYLLSLIPREYRTSLAELSSHPYVEKLMEYLKECFSKIKDLQQDSFQKLYKAAKVYFEDYLTTVKPPSLSTFFVVNTLNSDKGIFDVNLNLNIELPFLRRMANYFSSRIRYLMALRYHYNWNTLLKLKRLVDFNFIPPYSEQAMLVGQQYFVTFDKTFYDFAGECSYLLSRDFEDGNFTLALKPKESEKGPAVLFSVRETTVEINAAENSVKVNDNAVDLPFISDHINVIREGSTIIASDNYGVEVKCHLVHEVCTFVISGWYYDKTAGLLGTYNYEPSDDFRRPKGQIANNPAVHAKSWELKRGCKTNNLVPEAHINPNSDYYKLCRKHFVENTSPLSACFADVNPDEYFQLCLRHLSRENDGKKAFCNVATAYVMECERNYLELNLPSNCLKCEAPGGAVLQHGDRKKYEGLSQKSIDVIFIVEDHTCNKVIANDLTNIARSIDKELQNEGFRDNMYGVIGFGGDIGSPLIHTAKGRVLFGSKDINSAVERIKLQSTKNESSRAFEAMKLAVTYLFRSETARSFILLSCSPCNYDFRSLQYPVIEQILLERGITLHVINNADIHIKKSIKEKGIIGADPDTVYRVKDVTQRDLVGEPELRSQVALPKDLCVALSQDVNGSYFSTHLFQSGSQSDVKNWRSLFARKFLKSVQVFPCQWCDCTSTPDHIANSICQPCEIKRPRLPFSVCTSCVLSRSVLAFLSYILHAV